MTLNVTGLAKNASIPVNIEGIINVPSEYCLLDASISADLKGKLINAGSCYILEGWLDASFTKNCDKCLKPVDVQLEIEFCEKFYNHERNGSRVLEIEDVWEFTGEMIDVKPAVTTCCLLALPLKTLCSEDCKGLCYICGKNLNLGECGCRQSYINPRFEGLLSLFQDKEV